MADNYLEKRYEEVFENPRPKVVRQGGPSLDSLFVKNRSVRGFDQSRVVSEAELLDIIGVNPAIASSKNMQALRFHPVTKDTGAGKVNANIKMAALFRKHQATAAIKENFPSLPLPGTEPEAFVIICSTVDESPSLFIDLGISLQSMSLKAVEMGLNCLMIRSINHPGLEEAFGLEHVVAVLAVGKSAEKIYLVPTDGKQKLSQQPEEAAPLDYFRRDGIHYVPKLRLEDILV